MSNKFTRASLNFEFYKRINTDITPFETVLYFFKNSDNMLLEIPDKGKCYITSKNDIKKYITLGDVETPWERLIDDSYMRIKGTDIIHILPISTEFEFVHLTLEFKMYNNDLNMVRTIKEKNFKTRKKYAKSRTEVGYLTVSAFLPLWPLWARTSRSTALPTNKHSLHRLYMKIGSIFYRFPYGNVNGEDAVCLGGSNLRDFTNPKQMWINFVTTTFNTDYTFNTRANKINSPSETRRYSDRNSRSQNEVGTTINVPTFNLEEISVRLSTKREEVFKRISYIDVLYYLSHIEDFDEFDHIDVFYKLPKEPWEMKE